jgi:hypothetical protein
MIQTNHGMSLIGNRGDFLSALFSALLALALFGHGAATAQEVKQIKLTDKHIQGFMAAYEDIAKVYDVIGAQDEDDVFERHYRHQRPKDQRDDPQHIGRGRNNSLF